MKRSSCVLVAFLLVASFVFYSLAPVFDGEQMMMDQTNDATLAARDYVPRDIRVAIYDEPNMTAPAYATHPGGVKNNVSGLTAILENYGYTVTALDVHDIYNYELTTINYDILCLPDNFPRENITHRILDFWLGGGGILAFDGSVSFLCYFGVFPPEAVGTSGSGTYWTWSGVDVIITTRHPVSQSVSGSFDTVSSGSTAFYFPALLGSSIASDLTKVATTSVSPDWASIIAYDPSDRGGRIVTISNDLVNDPLPGIYPLYADAVDWLAPRPKARILYDLTHQPWCPTDPWEWSGDSNYLTTWRNSLVANHYTVDKLHPSLLGNLTAENLAPYDMLVTNQPMMDISVSEIQAVEEWVQAGGGLFVIGDNPGVPDNYRLDELIAPYGFQFNDTVASYSEIVSTFDRHPTTEGCTSLEYQGATNLILSGNAYPIWSYAPGEVAAGAVEYGAGRVVVICDVNSVLDTWIGTADNHPFAMNVANWLTSSKASVLLFHNTGIPLYNHYRSAVADALNELGINYMLTYEPVYFNLSFTSQTWDLVIHDANSLSAVNNNERFFIEHLENDGRLIMRDYLFRYDTFSLWHYLGFRGCGSEERITDGAPTIYMWNQYHDIFNRPVDFSVDHFDSTSNQFVTDWTNVTVLGNATAIAGITPTIETNQSAILLGVGGQALCNMFAISEYYDDFDDTTYPDNFELWLNEIAYMMRPTIDSPGNLVIDLYTDPAEFTWTPHSYAPGDYQIKRDSVIIATQWWYGSPITVDVSGLSIGVYEFELTVRDHVGYRVEDTITVEIVDTTPTTTPTPTPTPSPTPTTTPEPLPSPDMTTMMLIIGGAGVIIIVIIIIMRKK